MRRLHSLGLISLLIAVAVSALLARSRSVKPIPESSPTPLAFKFPQKEVGEVALSITEGGGGCHGSVEKTLEWVKTERGYERKDQLLSFQEMEKLKEIILSTSEARDPLSEFEDLPDGQDLSRRLQERFPWIESPPPTISQREIRKRMTQDLTLESFQGRTYHYVEVEFPGNPSLTLSYSDSGMGVFSGGLPTWKIWTRTATWETQSPRVAAALSRWLEGEESQVHVQTGWPDQFLDRYSAVIGAAWAEDYLEQAAPRWPGATKFVIGGAEIRHLPWRYIKGLGSLTLQPRFRTIFDRFEVSFDASTGPLKDWNWLTKKISKAESTLVTYPSLPQDFTLVLEVPSDGTQAVRWDEAFLDAPPEARIRMDLRGESQGLLLLPPRSSSGVSPPAVIVHPSDKLYQALVGHPPEGYPGTLLVHPDGKVEEKA